MVGTLHLLNQIQSKNIFFNKTSISILSLISLYVFFLPGKEIKIPNCTKHRGRNTIHDKTLVRHSRAQYLPIGSSSHQELGWMNI